MNFESKTFTVRELLEHKSRKILSENPEYQRGKVWDKAQKKRLIDSLLRSYPLPLFYLHHKHWASGEFSQHTLDVIDGQQRLNAIEEFSKGDFACFDPALDRTVARFPKFLEDSPCPWGRKTFDQLSPEWQGKFQNTKLNIVQISDALDVEARDLFIRLQAGLPLNPQEKRDAWPGEFTDFVLKMAGKPELTGYPGHRFFTSVMKAVKSDRGKLRQLFAQIFLLCETRRSSGHLANIKRADVDDLYYQNLTFSCAGEQAVRMNKVADLLASKLDDGTRPKLINYEAIALFLLVDGLIDGYVPSWSDRLAVAFDKFLHEAKVRKSDTTGEFYTEWILPAKASSDQRDSIEKRQKFFHARMFTLLDPIPKDNQRGFSAEERAVIYFRDKKLCGSCGGLVPWEEAEFHHITPHSQGGLTTISNGATVHKQCHPLDAQRVKEFATKWQSRTAS
jgi:hypothetical protein